MPEKILIVDDDLDTLKLIGLILQRQGYEITAANGGNSALTKVAADHPDIILLDLMMPDLDGYEVTRRLRADPSTAQIPIIMFTAKALLDDKVAGFEAGADDYLTKPIHPAELLAHVKALLARTQVTPVVATDRARLVGVVAAKGGVGVTTIALNLAAAAAQNAENVILAEIRPGQGSLGLMLGLADNIPNLTGLLTKPVSGINEQSVGSQLSPHPSGIRILPASIAPKDAGLINNAQQMEAIVKTLSKMSKLLVLDLGTGINETTRRLALLCEKVIVVTDPAHVTLIQTKAMLSDLETLGLGAARLDLVMVNQAAAALQVSWQKAEQLLGRKMTTIITPAAELAYQAIEAGTPMVLLRPDSLTADQLRTLTTHVMQGLRAPITS
jgi:pilus assembly protein CpaE